MDEFYQELLQELMLCSLLAAIAGARRCVAGRSLSAVEDLNLDQFLVAKDAVTFIGRCCRWPVLFFRAPDPDSGSEVDMEDVFAHSANMAGARHSFAAHARATAELARRFAEPFGAGDLAYPLGLLHDAGKVDCAWQNRLLVAEKSGGRVGGRHWELGAKLLLAVANHAALAVLGHHGGLTKPGDLEDLADTDLPDEAANYERLVSAIPEIESALSGRLLIPSGWLRDWSVLEMGIRMVFSALVDADHLDTGAHFDGMAKPAVADPVDMAGTVRRFESRRAAMLAERCARQGVSPLDVDRSALYEEVVSHAQGSTGVYRLPAPTGSGKTVTGAGFGLRHAAHHGKARVIVAVPFLTITEQNAAVYRDLLGEDSVLEHHSQAEFDGGDHRARLAAENWDAPFVVTTTVQLFDSLFGRRPARSRKLHRLANAVVVLDEVQALPLTLLAPILDGLRVLTEQFGTTVVLTSATQPSFQRLGAWSDLRVHELVARPQALFDRFRRVVYEWRVEPKPTLAQIADEVAAVPEQQALVVVNTIDQARSMFGSLADRVTGTLLHLSTRMCPLHRRHVLNTARRMLADRQPVTVVSTQLIEAGVDIDFPVVFRAMAPAESLQQAAGRANREGTGPRPGRVVVFDAADAPTPRFYQSAVSATRVCFGPEDGKAAPDDLAALDAYYRSLYSTTGVADCRDAQEVQTCRKVLDYEGTADAFRMIDEDTVPVVITAYRDRAHVEALLRQLADPERRNRQTFRSLRPYQVALPRRLIVDPRIAAQCVRVLDGVELYRWEGRYDDALGVSESVSGMEMIL
jgi:CRISPR-associated endonuclease/helicase Cas3